MHYRYLWYFSRYLHNIGGYVYVYAQYIMYDNPVGLQASAVSCHGEVGDYLDSSLRHIVGWVCA